MNIFNMDLACGAFQWLGAGNSGIFNLNCAVLNTNCNRCTHKPKVKFSNYDKKTFYYICNL